MKKNILISFLLLSLMPAWLLASVSITSITANDVTCYGNTDGSASLSVTGTAPFSYIWSNAFNGATITQLPAGVYNVTVTDAAATTVTGTVTVNQPTLLQVQVSATDAYCYGGTGQVQSVASGGTAPYVYTWNNGVTTPNNYSLTPGTYTLTLTDSHGCTALGSKNVTQPAAALTSTTSVTYVGCYGTSTGTVTTISSGGSVPYRYVWSTGATTQNITGLSPGSYLVTVSDANGCSVVVSAAVTGLPQPSASFTLQEDTAQAHHWFLLYNTTNFIPTQYLWNWDDGTTSTGANPSHTYADSGYYNICMTLTNAAGCTVNYCDSSTYLRSALQLAIGVQVVAPVTTGINNVSNSITAAVYPNPVSNTLHLSTNMQGTINYQVYNTTGQIVFEGKTITKDFDINVNALSNGIYLIKLKSGQAEHTARFVKE